VNFLHLHQGYAYEHTLPIENTMPESQDIGIDIDYIEPAVGKKWIQETKELSAMLVGLSKSLRKIN